MAADRLSNSISRGMSGTLMLRSEAMAHSTDADVLVLGAGVAGLSAARDLAKSQRVIVIEARDRVGGRLHTRRHLDHPLPIELGPEFVHGHMPDTFALLGEARLIAYDIVDKHDTMRGGKLVGQADAWQKTQALLDRMSGLREDVSFEDFLRHHARTASPQARMLARNFVEGFNAADARLISCRSLVKASEEETKQDDGEKQYRLIGGYDQLAEALARSVAEPSKIQLSTVARHIRWRRGEVLIDAHGPNGEIRYRAPRAIIALPLGVLQAPAGNSGAVTFEPELPTRDAIQELLVMGNVMKLTFRFRSPFWEALGHKELAFVHRNDLALPTWWSMLPLRTGILTAWAGGPAADKVIARGEPETQAIESLATLLEVPKERIARELERIDHHDWSADPFSRGAYSYAKVGGAAIPERLARPIAGTLFFAGEHTHGGLLGTVAGAIHSGQRAAKAASRK